MKYLILASAFLLAFLEHQFHLVAFITKYPWLLAIVGISTLTSAIDIYICKRVVMHHILLFFIIVPIAGVYLIAILDRSLTWKFGRRKEAGGNQESFIAYIREDFGECP